MSSELECMKKKMQLMRLIMGEFMSYASFNDTDMEAMMLGLETLIFIEPDHQCETCNLKIINAVKVAERLASEAKQREEVNQLQAELEAHKAAGGVVN